MLLQCIKSQVRTADFFHAMISFTNSAILKSGKCFIATTLNCRRKGKLKMGCRKRCRTSFNLNMPSVMKANLTKKLFSQHAQLICIKSSLCYRRKLPTQNIRELRPLCTRWIQKEGQVLECKRKIQAVVNKH